MEIQSQFPTAWKAHICVNDDHVHWLWTLPEHEDSALLIQPETEDYMCFHSFSILPLSSPRSSIVGPFKWHNVLGLGDQNALTHATTLIRSVWQLWVCPLKISIRMLLIFNMAPILGVRCKKNVDERNPSLSLPSCLCRVMRPPHNLSTWKQSNAGTASVRLIKINSWFNTAPFKALQSCNSLARAIKLTWILLGTPGCESSGQCCKKENICNCNLKSWQLNLFFLQAVTIMTKSARLICAQMTLINWFFFISHSQYYCKSLALYSLVS